LFCVLTAILWCMEHEHDEVEETSDDDEEDFTQMKDIQTDKSFAGLTADLQRIANEYDSL